MQRTLHPATTGRRAPDELTYDREEFQRGLDENLAFIERWRGHPRVVPCLGPHTPDTLDTEMLLECSRAAEELDVKMLIHVAESQAEIVQVRKKGYRGSSTTSTRSGFSRRGSRRPTWCGSTTRRSRLRPPAGWE